MTIKEQIYQKVEEIKKIFIEETGIELVAFPALNLEKEEIKQIRDTVEEVTGIRLPGRDKKQEAVWARAILTTIANNMGYTDREIQAAVGGNRTNMVRYKANHRQNMIQSAEYKRLYNKVLAEVHKKQNI